MGTLPHGSWEAQGCTWQRHCLGATYKLGWQLLHGAAQQHGCGRGEVAAWQWLRWARRRGMASMAACPPAASEPPPLLRLCLPHSLLCPSPRFASSGCRCGVPPFPWPPLAPPVPFTWPRLMQDADAEYRRPLRSGTLVLRQHIPQGQWSLLPSPEIKARVGRKGGGKGGEARGRAWGKLSHYCLCSGPLPTMQWSDHTPCSPILCVVARRADSSLPFMWAAFCSPSRIVGCSDRVPSLFVLLRSTSLRSSGWARCRMSLISATASWMVEV